MSLYWVFQNDEVFTFNFNLIMDHEGDEVTYELSQTCSPTLPWSSREITCEANYMEVILGTACKNEVFASLRDY